MLAPEGVAIREACFLFAISTVLCFSISKQVKQD